MPNSIDSVASNFANRSATGAGSSAPVSTAGPGGALGKDEFLQLLTTQLKYQDPMNPMDGSKMASELATFSSLEQLVNINDALETTKTQQDIMLLAINNNVALSTIGKTVVAAGDQVVLAKDPVSGDVGGKVMADITTEGDGVLKLYNAAGKEIASRPLGYLTTGDKKEFDVGSAATGLSEGKYTYKIEVTDSKGKAVTQTSYMIGKVDGISYDSTGAVLTSGPLDIPIGSIIKIVQ
jgi:flagellar basal-body rod modification protein FlgD